MHPTPTPPTCQAFHCDVDATQTPSTGVIDLESTGVDGKVHRTVEVAVKRLGFGDFLFFSDIETVDPANPFVYGTDKGTAQAVCGRHYGDSPARDMSYCPDISLTGDTVNGPLHSNDALLV